MSHYDRNLGLSYNLSLVIFLLNQMDSYSALVITNLKHCLTHNPSVHSLPNVIGPESWVGNQDPSRDSRI